MASLDGFSPTVSIFKPARNNCSGVSVRFWSPAVAVCGLDDSPKETDRGAGTGLPVLPGHRNQARIATAAIAIIATIAATAVLGPLAGCTLPLSRRDAND